MKSSSIRRDVITDINSLNEALSPLAKNYPGVHIVTAQQYIGIGMPLNRNETDVKVVQVSLDHISLIYSVKVVISQYDISNELVFSIPALDTDLIGGSNMYVLEKAITYLLERYCSRYDDDIIE